MLFRAFVTACVLLGSTAPAMAQQRLFDNPFADVATYASTRGGAADATYRVRYEVTRARPGTAPTVSEMVIDVAPDWSLTREVDRSVLRDFRLNRTFVLTGNQFFSSNGMGDLVSRIMERQNRTYLQRVVAAAGGPAGMPDDCDADSELGVSMPGATGASATAFRARDGVRRLRCGEREIGGFTAGSGAAPPAAFWPTAFHAVTAHPALFREMRASGRAPALLETAYNQAPSATVRNVYRLVAVETVSTPYPLIAGMRNITAQQVDEALGAGTGELAEAAVAGRAAGGAPTLQSWGEHLRDVERREGRAAAAMLLMPTYNMFPELEGACSGPAPHPMCALNRDLRAIAAQDPAPFALLEIGMAEQRNDQAAAIAAMQRAQASPLREHPALGASFALALLKFNQASLAQARAANLPTNVAELQTRAVMALPYNPAYWTDIGDRYGANYEWPMALTFYDIAFSLPMPSAIERHRLLISKRALMERIHRDFPDAFLPATP